MGFLRYAQSNESINPVLIIGPFRNDFDGHIIKETSDTSIIDHILLVVVSL